MVVCGQVRLYERERVVAMLELEREAGGGEEQLVKAVVSVRRVERQTAIAELSVRSQVLTF